MLKKVAVLEGKDEVVQYKDLVGIIGDTSVVFSVNIDPCIIEDIDDVRCLEQRLGQLGEIYLLTQGKLECDGKGQPPMVHLEASLDIVAIVGAYMSVERAFAILDAIEEPVFDPNLLYSLSNVFVGDIAVRINSPDTITVRGYRPGVFSLTEARLATEANRVVLTHDGVRFQWLRRWSH